MTLCSAYPLARYRSALRSPDRAGLGARSARPSAGSNVKALQLLKAGGLPFDTPVARGAAGLPEYITQLQQTLGNRAVGTILARSRIARTRPIQRDDLGTAGKDYKVGGREQFELSFVLHERASGVKVQFKITGARKGSKVLESPTAAGPIGGEASWSLGENKTALEKAGGKWGAKLTSTVARADWSGGPIPGFPALRVRATAKGPEAKFDITKGEADLDLLKISLAADGDVIELLDWAGLAHLKDRVSLKATLQIEKGISIRDLKRLKTAIQYKDEAERAAKEAEKHADDFAKYKQKLDREVKRRPQLKKRLQGEQVRLKRATAALERAEAAGPGRGVGAKGQRARNLRALRAQKAAAERAVAQAEKTLYRNWQQVRVNRHFLDKARSGLASAGKRLANAGRKMDAALKNVSDKLSKPIKKALEKATKRIMKRVAGKLIAKGLAYLVPGLNLAMTLWDIGSLLHSVFSDSKGGVPGGEGDGEGEEGGGGGEEGTKGEGGAGESEATGGAEGKGGAGESGKAGQGTQGPGGQLPPSPDTGTGGPGGKGPGAAPPTKLQLTVNAKQLVEAFNGDPVALEDDAIKTINDAVPTDITTDELAKLVERLEDRAPTKAADPFEIAVEIQAELAALRAGEPTITFEGKPEEAAPRPEETKAEPPKTLLPATRTDVMNVLKYDAKKDEFGLEPSFEKDYKNHTLAHADGLQVKLTAFDVSSSRPSAAEEVLMIKTSITIEVVALPPHAAADYPWKVGETKTEKMTFLHEPKRRLWGEMDYSHVAQLKAVLTRSGNTWTVTRSGHQVRFQYAVVTVNRVVASRVVDAPDGGSVHKIAVEVTPTEILGKRAGFTTSQGWIEFKLKQPVVIPIELAEDSPTKKQP